MNTIKLLLILPFFLLSCQHSHTTVPKQFYTYNIQAKTVRVTGEDADKGWGTGFILKSTKSGSYIVTASHVVKSLDTYVVHFQNFEYKATLFAEDEKIDVAILKIEENLKINTKIGQTYVGQEIACVGYPRLQGASGAKLSISRGSILTRAFKEHLHRIDAIINYGSSGGPCFSDKEEVVGIVLGFYFTIDFFGNPMPIPGEYFMLNAESIQKFVDNENLTD